MYGKDGWTGECLGMNMFPRTGMRRQRMGQQLRHQNQSRLRGMGLEHYNGSRTRYENSTDAPEYYSVDLGVRTSRILGICRWETSATGGRQYLRHSLLSEKPRIYLKQRQSRRNLKHR